VTGPAKRKGDDAEREALDVLRSLGLDVRRNYGAGRPDDIADLTIGNLVAA
jgi:Holliday junction resolvase